jgi:hypothetical protein
MTTDCWVVVIAHCSHFRAGQDPGVIDQGHSNMSCRSLTFGRISTDCSGDEDIRCGGHAVEARCITLDGRFPLSIAGVLRKAHIFAELAGAAKRSASPQVPP